MESFHISTSAHSVPSRKVGHAVYKKWNSVFEVLVVLNLLLLVCPYNNSVFCQTPMYEVQELPNESKGGFRTLEHSFIVRDLPRKFEEGDGFDATDNNQLLGDMSPDMEEPPMFSTVREISKLFPDDYFLQHEISADLSENNSPDFINKYINNQQRHDTVPQKRSYKRPFHAWAGKRSYKRPFHAWAGKRSGKRPFHAWAGKRSAKRPFHAWSGKRSGHTPIDSIRKLQQNLPIFEPQYSLLPEDPGPLTAEDIQTLDQLSKTNPEDSTLLFPTGFISDETHPLLSDDANPQSNADLLINAGRNDVSKRGFLTRRTFSNGLGRPMHPINYYVPLRLRRFQMYLALSNVYHNLRDSERNWKIPEVKNTVKPTLQPPDAPKHPIRFYSYTKRPAFHAWSGRKRSQGFPASGRFHNNFDVSLLNSWAKRNSDDFTDSLIELQRKKRETESDKRDDVSANENQNAFDVSVNEHDRNKAVSAEKNKDVIDNPILHEQMKPTFKSFMADDSNKASLITNQNNDNENNIGSRYPLSQYNQDNREVMDDLDPDTHDLYLSPADDKLFINHLWKKIYFRTKGVDDIFKDRDNDIEALKGSYFNFHLKGDSNDDVVLNAEADKVGKAVEAVEAVEVTAAVKNSSQSNDAQLVLPKRRAFSAWSGKRVSTSNDKVDHNPQEFHSWAVKRPAFHSWAGKRKAFHSWAGKRRAFHSWAGKRKAFQPWAGKRQMFHSWAGKRAMELPNSDRTYIDSLILKSLGTKRRAFSPWLG